MTTSILIPSRKPSQLLTKVVEILAKGYIVADKEVIISQSSTHVKLIRLPTINFSREIVTLFKFEHGIKVRLRLFVNEFGSVMIMPITILFDIEHEQINVSIIDRITYVYSAYQIIQSSVFHLVDRIFDEWNIIAEILVFILSRMHRKPNQLIFNANNVVKLLKYRSYMQALDNISADDYSKLISMLKNALVDEIHWYKYRDDFIICKDDDHTISVIFLDTIIDTLSFNSEIDTLRYNDHPILSLLAAVIRDIDGFDKFERDKQYSLLKSQILTM